MPYINKTKTKQNVHIRFNNRKIRANRFTNSARHNRVRNNNGTKIIKMGTLTETEKAWITMMVQAYGMNEQTALSYIQNVNTNK